MGDCRVGFGYDAHRFGGPGPIVLCGVTIDHPTGVRATSDGDVAAHAVSDGLLGAAALGDMGTFFPSTDPAWEGVRSMELVARCVEMVAAEGFGVVHVDLSIVAQDVRIAPHRTAMRDSLGDALGVSREGVSVKATTTDGLGWIGAGEGLAAMAVVTIQS